MRRGKILGWKGYATIVRDTQCGPVHAVDLVERMSLTRSTARKVLTRLHELRVIYIASWLVIKPAKTAIPVYRFGAEPDAPGIGGKPGGWVRKPMAMRNRLPELTHFVTILRALEDPISLPKLCEATGSKYSNLSPLLKHLKSLRMARIAEWEVTRQGPVALYALGAGNDMPRPRPMPKSEVNARYAAAQIVRAKQSQILRALHFQPDEAMA